MNTKDSDIALIREYLAGKLDDRAMYELERRAQDDPVLSDLMDGLASAPASVHDRYLRDIDERLARRVRPASRPGWGTTWRVAASVALLLSIGIVWFVNRPEPSVPGLAGSPVLVPERARPESLPDARKEPSGTSPHQPAIRNQANRASALRNSPAVPLGDTSLVASNPVPAAVYSPDEAKRNESPLVKDADLRELGMKQALGDRVEGAIPLREMSRLDARASIEGMVTDRSDRLALPGVMIRVKGDQRGVQTDAQGKFRLGMVDSISTIQVSALGYKTQELRVHDGQKLVIHLSHDVESLSEVVVTKGSLHESKKAAPLGGWKSYEKFLEENAAAAGKKSERVIVKFKVAADGSISGLLAIRGGNDSLKARALDLVKNGPSWRGRADGKSQTIRLKVKFPGTKASGGSENP